MINERKDSYQSETSSGGRASLTIMDVQPQKPLHKYKHTWDMEGKRVPSYLTFTHIVNKLFSDIIIIISQKHKTVIKVFASSRRAFQIPIQSNALLIVIYYSTG